MLRRRWWRLFLSARMKQLTCRSSENHQPPCRLDSRQDPGRLAARWSLKMKQRTNPPLEILKLPRSDRKSTRLNSSHRTISYAVFCLKKKRTKGDYINDR